MSSGILVQALPRPTPWVKYIAVIENDSGRLAPVVADTPEALVQVVTGSLSSATGLVFVRGEVLPQKMTVKPPRFWVGDTPYLLERQAAMKPPNPDGWDYQLG